VSYEHSRRSRDDNGPLRGSAALSLRAFLSDNGVSWTFEGVPHSSWNEEEIDQLRSVSGDAFEVVALGEIYR
jgi:hypothetical protein